MAQARDPDKEEIIKRRHFAFRLNVFFFCVFALFSILIVRLAILQFVEGDSLKAMKNYSSIASYEIPPIRGNIYDRLGVPIAVSTSTQTLYYQYDGGQTADDVVQLAKNLEAVFRKYGDPNAKVLTAEEIVKLMDSGYDIHKNKVQIIGYASSLRKIKTDLTDHEIAYIMENRDELPNVDIVEESVRQYVPNGVDRNQDTDYVAVQLIGYLRQYSTAVNDIAYYQNSNDYLLTEMVGMDGIELMYEKELRGLKGRKTYPINALGQIVGDPVVEPAVKGNNLYLTIDKDVQKATRDKIIEHIEFLRTDPETRRINPKGVNAASGYAVAMEVDTGKVVAMVSYPDYDPNIWRNGRISTQDWNDLQYRFPNGTITGTIYDHPDPDERRKHPGSVVPLGSTMKPLTVLVGLNEKLITTSTQYNDRGIFYYGRDNNANIKNAGQVPYGLMDPERSLAVSSNTFMAEMIGNPLYSKYWSRENPAGGVDVWDEYMKQFGLGVRTGSGLPNEHVGVLDYYGMVKNASAQAALVYASFGQGARYTTLQLAQYAATLASKGKRMKPQFVEKITAYDGTTVQEFEPEVLNTVEFPEEYWRVVEAGMLRVFKVGFEDFPYTIATKTGTSEMDVAGDTVENAVFIAYAPVEDPKLAVAVVVPEGGYGARGAAPIARAMFDAYDKAIGLVDND